MGDVFGGERTAARQAHLDGAAAGEVNACQAGGQSGGVISDYQVAGTQEIGECRARSVGKAALRIHHQEPGVRWTLDGLARGDHTASMGTARFARALAIASAGSRAAVL